MIVHQDDTLEQNGTSRVRGGLKLRQAAAALNKLH